MKKSSFLAVLGFVAVVFLSASSAMAGQRDIPVPDAGFDDHVLNSRGGYIYIGDSSYTGAWKSVLSAGAYIDYHYWDGDMPARSGNLKAYPSDGTTFDYIYQILDETFVEGDTYTLSVWVGNAWPAEGYADGWGLYFTAEDYEINLIEAHGLALSSEWEQISLVYTATAADAGSRIGIKMSGEEGESYVTFEDVTLSRESVLPLPLAYDPEPGEGQMIEATVQPLTWKPGDLAVSHNVYFGDTFDDVNQATPEDDAFIGNQSELLFLAQGLTPGATYYWRIDEVNDVHPDSPWRGDIWSFLVRPTEAWDPRPVDGMRNVDPNQDLSWDTGLGAIFHTVYFSKNFDEVKNGTVLGIPGANPTYEPGPLDLDTTYYWRVDEFAHPANQTYPGPVWSFTTRGEGGGVKAEYFDGMALAGDPILSQIEPAIDHQWGNGEVAGGLADLVSARWRANLEAPFTETYRLITSTDDGVRLWLDGRLVIDKWIDQGTTDWTATANLVAGQYYMIEMEWYENGGGAVAQLSWQSDTLPRQIIPQGWLQLPLRATSPSPAHLNPHADQASILTWNAGDDATGHDVYFGDDAAAVAGADTTTTGIYRGRQAAGATSFNPGPLEWGKTYYWRVDEVNPDGVLAGAVWTFTAADFIVVDDFEGYTDNNLEYEAIFQTWIDGFGYTEPEDVMGNGTGSTVGYISPPFAEQTIVHSGYTSMPMDYNNVISPYYSETERTWTGAQDWTVNGMDTLTLYFRGTSKNGPGNLYVALQDSSNNTRAVPHPDPAAVNTTQWTEWQIPMSQFTGVNATRIKKMFVGVGNRSAPTPGGAGTLYIDDIGVTKAATP